MCFRGFGSGFSCVRIEITAGDGKFAIAHCFDDGQLRGIAMAMIVIVVLSFYVFRAWLLVSMLL